jgi:aminopeptidase N
MRDSILPRRTTTTQGATVGKRHTFRLALAAQAAAVMMLAACGGGGDDTLSPAGSKLGADGSQQQANVGNNNAQAPAVDASVPPVELPDYIKPINYKLWKSR